MTMRKIGFLAAFGAAFLLANAAQGQYAPNHAVVLGKGAAVKGFGSAAPGTSGLPLLSQGASADPAFGSLALSGLSSIGATTIVGNSTGVSAVPSALSVTTVTSMLNAMVGDSGSGGTKGLVPAPGSGDTAAGKFLKADGTWAVPSGGLGSANTWTGTNAFQAGLSFGTSAPAPATADLYGYNTTRSILSSFKRAQNLSVGSIIGEHDFRGDNSTGTDILWGYMQGGVNDCLVKYSTVGSGGNPVCWGNENVAAAEAGMFNFFVVNGGTNYVRVAKIDDNGIEAKVGNMIVARGQGFVSYLSDGTPIYLLTHDGSFTDITGCSSSVSTVNCSLATRGIRFFTDKSAAAGQPAMEILGDNTIIINSLNGSGVAGSHALCLDSSNRLFKAPTASAACP